MPTANRIMYSTGPARAASGAPVAMALAMIVVTGTGSAREIGESEARRPVDRLGAVVGKSVSVELENGTEFAGVKLLRVIRDSESGSPLRLRVQLANGRRRLYQIDTIKALEFDGEVVYPSAGPAVRGEPAMDAAGEERERWLAKLAARGVRPWPKLTEQDHQAAIRWHKERYQEVATQIPGLQLVETAHFLFCTNIPPHQVAVYIKALDRMYSKMRELYRIEPGVPIWRGKASFFVFARKEEFLYFAYRFMNQRNEYAFGRCHTDGERKVTVYMQQGSDPAFFAGTLVHETAHGFIHCYKTPVPVPSWVNEGMAEVITSILVPAYNKTVRTREKKFHQALLGVPRPRLGDEFFVVKKNIPGNRYGGASSMTRFLIARDQTKYVEFINRIKDGEDWEEALRNSFQATKVELVSAYGRWIGVPHLQP